MITKTTAADTLGALYDAHFPTLQRVALRLCVGDDTQAEDLVLETLYHAAGCLHTVRAAGSVRGWLCRSLRNRYLSDRRRPRPVALDALDDVLTADSPGPEAQALDSDFTREVLAGCHDPKLFRAVALDGVSLTDYARQTGENLSTVTSRFRRDCARLRARSSVTGVERPKSARKKIGKLFRALHESGPFHASLLCRRTAPQHPR